MARGDGAAAMSKDPSPSDVAAVYLQHGPYGRGDRKSTRLNSSHLGISYAVFCLTKKDEKPRAFLHGAHVRTLSGGGQRIIVRAGTTVWRPIQLSDGCRYAGASCIHQ